ncbi:MAG: O-antigen ligase family protein [Candidatus Elarobacter sp.]
MTFQRQPTGRNPIVSTSPANAEPRPDRLMRAVALMIFTYVWRIQDAFPILGKLQIALIALIAAVLIFAGVKHPMRRIRAVTSQRTSQLIFALLVLMIIGVPFSLWFGHSAEFVLKSYVPDVVFYILVASTVRTIRDIEWYALMNLYGALAFAIVVALFFHVGGDGRLGSLIYYDANDFALVMVCTIPFAFYFLGKGQKASRRITALVALGMFLTAMVKSGSRGGFIGLIGIMVYILLFYRAIPSRTRLLITVAGVALFFGFASDKYWEMMSTILHPTTDYNYTSNEGRVEVWKRGMGYMMHNPVVGVGVAAYPMAEGGSDLAQSLQAQGAGFKWSVAHNSFLETGAELGIPGLAVFVAILIVTGVSLSRISKRGKFKRWVSTREISLAQMLIATIVGFAISGIFVSAEYFAYLYFLLALSVGLVKLVRMRAMSGPPPKPQINVRLAPRTAPAEADLGAVRNAIEATIQGADARR